MQNLKSSLSEYYKQASIENAYEAFCADPRTHDLITQAEAAEMGLVAKTTIQNLFLLHSTPKSGLSEQEKTEWFFDANQFYAGAETIEKVVSAVREHTDKLKREYAPTIQ